MNILQPNNFYNSNITLYKTVTYLRSLSAISKFGLYIEILLFHKIVIFLTEIILLKYVILRFLLKIKNQKII